MQHLFQLIMILPKTQMHCSALLKGAVKTE